MALRFRPGTSLDLLLEDLRGLAMEARNALPQRLEATWQHYLGWVNKTEGVLAGSFSDVALWASLRGSTYWHIRAELPVDPRWSELVSQELELQAAWLDQLADDVRAVKARLDAGRGTFVVLDTHVLLHYQPPEQIKWSEALSEPEVRLVLPLRVVEELDNKKYTARPEVADRARRLLARLGPLLTASRGLPTQIGDVTIEIPIERGPRARSADADYEVLQACLELQAVQCRVVLVTGDTGLSVRAAYEGVDVVALPEKYLREKAERS